MIYNDTSMIYLWIYDVAVFIYMYNICVIYVWNKIVGM